MILMCALGQFYLYLKILSLFLEHIIKLRNSIYTLSHFIENLKKILHNVLIKILKNREKQMKKYISENVFKK